MLKHTRLLRHLTITAGALLLALPLCLGAVSTARAEGGLKPYLLTPVTGGSLDAVQQDVMQRLAGAGFEVVGQHEGLSGVRVLAVTSAAQKTWAAQSTHGGFGAVLRLAITQTPKGVEVSHVAPGWLAAAFRMQGHGEELAQRLTAALGAGTPFGSNMERSDSQVRSYVYTLFMPDFTDVEELASYPTQQAALNAVEAGLAAHAGGVSKVYRVDLPGKEESVFGVALGKGDGADSAVMAVVDGDNSPKHSAHLPYELLVSGGKVMTLHGKFRIAQSFPDLGMGTFMKISSAPDAIADALKAVAKGQ
ncbi:MAG: hypothetical protein H7831_12655 [Magnetococcus sp. WYHC-3]